MTALTSSTLETAGSRRRSHWWNDFVGAAARLFSLPSPGVTAAQPDGGGQIERRISFAAVAEVQVGQCLKLLVGRFLDGDQVLVRSGRRAHQLVELALQRGDLARLVCWMTNTITKVTDAVTA